MHFKFLLLACLALWQKCHSAPCNCNLGSGVNICSAGGGIRDGTIITGPGGIRTVVGRDGLVYQEGGDGHPGEGNPADCSPLIVRAHSLPRIDIGNVGKPRVVCKKVGGDLPPLKPLAGSYALGKTRVVPALVPAPPCGGGCSDGGVVVGGGPGGAVVYGSGSTTHTSQSVGVVYPLGVPGGAAGPVVIPGGPITLEFPSCGNPSVKGPRRSSSNVPADKVSQDLAQQLQSTNTRADRALFIGFSKKPIEIKCVEQSKPRINEGNIHEVRGQELVLVPAPEVVEEDEEEELPEDEQEQDVVVYEEAYKPSYADIRYTYNQGKSKQFVDVVDAQAQLPSVPPCTVPDDRRNRLPCNDGYRGGQVVIESSPVDANGLPVQGGGYYSSSATSNCEESVLLRKVGYY